MAEAWGEFLSDWDGVAQLRRRVRELDDERVLVLVHASGRDKTSGLEFGQIGRRRGTCLFHVRSGRVTRLIVYYDFTGLGPVAEAGP